MKKIIDISIPLREGMVHWPGDVPFTRMQRTEIGKNDAQSNDSILLMSAHCGTHMDAPRHFYNEGRTAEAIDLSVTVGPCYVVDCTDWDTPLDSRAFSRVPVGTTRILVKTKNAGTVLEDDFHPEFIGLALDGAQWLREHGVLLFGSDYVAIGALSDGSIGDDHRAFLSDPRATALEGLDLRAVEEGEYDLVCLPLKVEGSDGAPCRAILMKEIEA